MCVILMIPLCSLYIQNEHNGQNFIVPLTSLPSLFYLTIVLKRISVFWKPLKFLNYFTKCNIYILSYTCDQSNLGHSSLLRYLLIELHDPISKLIKVQEAASWLSFELYEIEGNQLSGSSTIDFYNSEVVARKHLLKLMVLTVRPNAIKF